jgi:hypothetical protein
MPDPDLPEIPKLSKHKRYAAYKHRWYMAHREEIQRTAELKKLANPEKKREQNQRYYLKNREKRLADQKVYNEQHREERSAQGRKYRSANQENIRERKKLRYNANRETERIKRRTKYQLNREQILTKNKEWHEANPEQLRLIKQRYKKTHPEVGRINTSRRRARRQALPDTFTIEERQFMLDYWHHACAICGNQDGFFWTLADDHWIPLTSSDCPGTIAENMLPLCNGQGGCNTSKNSREAKTWLMSRYKPSQVKRILKTIETYFAAVRARKE